MPSVRKDRGLYREKGAVVGIGNDALAVHKRGFNCAQSVLGACGKHIDLDEKSALAISVGFGGGVRSGEICGAISGAVMALGYAWTHLDPAAPSAKRRPANAASDCVNCFHEKYGFVRCQELKHAGVSCPELIAYAAEYVEEKLKNTTTEE